MTIEDGIDEGHLLQTITIETVRVLNNNWRLNKISDRRGYDRGPQRGWHDHSPYRGGGRGRGRGFHRGHPRDY